MVAGIRTPLHLSELKKRMPKVYKQLEKVREKLEKHYRDMQDMEFTVESGKLYMLQTRTGKRSPAAAFRIAVDMANEKLIKVEEALERIKSEDVERLFYPVLDPKLPRNELASRKIARGINAVPGAAVGKAVFTARGSRGLGGARREGDSGAPRDQPGRCGRHVRGAGNSDGDRRQDQPRGGGRARVGEVLHRGRGEARHRCAQRRR